MENIRTHAERRLVTGLTAMSFAIGYFGQEFLPSVAMATSVGSTQTDQIGSIFGIAQIVGLLGLGMLTDYKRPLLPMNAAAGFFLVAALAGSVLDTRSLLLDRLFVGLACGAVGLLFRAVARLAETQTGSANRMTRIIGTTLTIGTAFGAFLPALGLWLASDAGRAIANVCVALIACVLIYRMPQPEHFEQHSEEIGVAGRLPVGILSITAFFSAGAYAIFFLIVSKEIAPALPVPPLLFWTITALLYLLAAAALWWINQHHGKTLKDAHGLAIAFVGSGLAYALPALGYAVGSPRLETLLLAQFLAIIAGAFSDSFWGSLVHRASSRKHDGATFGFTFTVSSAARMIWPLALSATLGQVANWQEILLILLIILCCNALLVLAAARTLEGKHS